MCLSFRVCNFKCVIQGKPWGTVTIINGNQHPNHHEGFTVICKCCRKHHWKNYLNFGIATKRNSLELWGWHCHDCQSYRISFLFYLRNSQRIISRWRYSVLYYQVTEWNPWWNAKITDLLLGSGSDNCHIESPTFMYFLLLI